jgi:hypothetical protein
MDEGISQEMLDYYKELQTQEEQTIQDTELVFQDNQETIPDETIPEETIEQEFQMDVGAYKRVSQFGPAAPPPSIMKRQLFMKSRSNIDFSKQKLDIILQELIPNVEVQTNVRNKLLKLDNLQIYNTDLLIFSQMYLLEEKKLDKILFDKFFKKYQNLFGKSSIEITKEDLIRYIRLLTNSF